jgi:release factor glutamine methyltransferase
MNKSFSRRIGKSLSKLQEGLLENELPKYLLDPENLTPAERYIAEIGIGMGDHFIGRARENPKALHIGFEPYLNGVANSLKLSKEQDIANILLWPDDMDLVFNKLPNNILDELYILFPDPWPKLRQQKRRIVNETRLQLFVSKLKPGGMMIFGSDIDHYFDVTLQLVQKSGYFKEIEAGTKAPQNYIKTRYHLKAEEEDRVPRFLSARKK